MSLALRIPQDRIGVSISEVCFVTGVGKSFVYDEIGKGHLQARKVGRRTIVLRDDLIRWIEACPLISPKKETANG